MADLVIGDVVGYVLDETVVPDRHVVQGRIMHAGMLAESAGEREFPPELSETHGAGEAHPLDMVHRRGGRQHVPPVFRFAAGGLQLTDFLLSKIPVFHARQSGFRYRVHNTCPSAPGARSACRAR